MIMEERVSEFKVDKTLGYLTAKKIKIKKPTGYLRVKVEKPQGIMPQLSLQFYKASLSVIQDRR